MRINILHNFFKNSTSCPLLTILYTSNWVRKILHNFLNEWTQGVMDKIDAFSAKQRTAGDVSGPVEADPEYQLIVEVRSKIIYDPLIKILDK